MSRSFAVAGRIVRQWQSRLMRLIGRRMAGYANQGSPPIQLALAARRSQDWQSIDALLEALREAESSSERAA